MPRKKSSNDATNVWIVVVVLILIVCIPIIIAKYARNGTGPGDVWKWAVKLNDVSDTMAS